MGIGSKLKKRLRKIIPNEVSEIAVKAAPFVAPFNPAISAAMAGIGSFDQTGRIGSSLKAGLGTYLGGQGARMLGGAGFQKGFGGGSGIGSYFTSPFTGNTMFGADKGSFFQGNNSIFGQGTPGTPQIIDSPLSTADPTAAYNASGQTGNVLVDGYTPPTATDLSLPGREGFTGTLSTPSTTMPDLSLTSGSSRAFQNTITNTANQEIAKTGGTSLTESLKEMFNAEGFGEKLKIAEQFAKDHPLTMSLLGGSVTAVMQYLENEANEEATKNDFRTFADMSDDTYNLQYVADGGPIVKEEKELTAREGILGPTANGGRPLFDPEKMSEKYAQGGRIGFQMGGGLFGGDTNYMQRNSAMLDDPQYQAWENIYSQNPDQAAMFPQHLAFKQLYESENKADGGRIGFAGAGRVSDQVKEIDIEREMNFLLRNGQALGRRGTAELRQQAIDNIQRNALDEFYDSLKNGGLAGYFNGGRVDLALGGGPNSEPTMEMDLRPGGFIPVGVAERADDVPARVSKNEFVMTADAVRAAGGGSVDKGAQVMYDLMNRLEGQA